MIYQDVRAQAVSHASAWLFQDVIQEFPDLPLEVVEYGSGCGIISIMCALARPKWHISGVEIQPELQALSVKNASLCEVEVSFLPMDFRDYDAKVDLIFANPPWQKKGSGRLSQNSFKNRSRFEMDGTMEDVLDSVAKCLKPCGTALLMYPISRVEEIKGAVANTLLDIKKVIFHGDKKQYFTAKIGIRNT